ncbi:manganese efflux pump [Clostridium estertheticum]|uniref:manganese efflux pump MntP n=1 Tax=Clostridium estertheticum TaxID=238834 RepID=UPI0013E98BAF|nr:manganese efflux pump [Clostridium estertheticum]MBZ9687015.1 manganese efflux pump [Clostridium estertheticum]
MSIGQFIITFFSILILALTLSADDFSVGVAYGLFKIRITLKSLIILVLGSATSTYGAMLIGRFIFTSMPGYITAWLSSIILATIGCKMLYNGWKGESDESEVLKDEPKRKVAFWETYIVGLGLGVDDFAQAFGLSLAGFPIILTVLLLETAEVIAILTGNYLAFKGLSKKVNGKLSIIPGIVLILVALYQILF